MKFVAPMLFAATLALPATAVFAQTPDAKTYVMKAGAGDLYEKTSSKLVMTSKNPKVRQFAQQMVTDHTKSTNDVKMAAKQAHVMAGTPKLDADQANMVAQLRKASGSARDQMYWDQQKTAHQMALQLHQDYAANGDAAPLKAAAGNIAPVVQSYIDMLNSGMM